MNMDAGIPVWILEIHCGSWDSIVDPGIALWTLVSNVDPGILFFLVDPGFPVWVLGFQRGCWYFSEDSGVPVQEYGNPRIHVRNLGFQW